MRPRFEYGAEVRVLRNVRNDGTFPGEPTGALLVRRGSTGFVRDVGTFLQDQIIYTVHFLDIDRVVGCREEELQPAAEPWTPSLFESREKVAARVALGAGGRVLVKPGTVGEIARVLRGAPRPDGSPGDVAYYVDFPGCNTLQVPESALEAPPASAGPSSSAPASAQAARSTPAGHAGHPGAREDAA